MTYNGNDNRLQMSLLDERTTDTVGLHSSMRAETHQTKRLKYAAMHHQYEDQVRIASLAVNGQHIKCFLFLKAKIHYAILVTDRSEAGRRPVASWNLAYQLAIAAS